MELGNGWLFSIGNGAVTRPLEKGKNTVIDKQSDQGLYSYNRFTSHHVNLIILYI